MSNLIYGVAATDALTITAVTVLLGLVALFARSSLPVVSQGLTP
jgi:hypothetical protein